MDRRFDVSALEKLFDETINDTSFTNFAAEVLRGVAYTGLDIRAIQTRVVNLHKSGGGTPEGLISNLNFFFLVTFERGTDCAKLSGSDPMNNRKALPDTQITLNGKLDSARRHYQAIVKLYEIVPRVTQSSSGGVQITPMRLTLCFPVAACRAASMRNSMPVNITGAHEKKHLAVLQTQALASLLPTERKLNWQKDITDAHLYCQYNVSEIINTGGKTQVAMEWNRMTKDQKVAQTRSYATLGMYSLTVPEEKRRMALDVLGLKVGESGSATVIALAEEWRSLSATN